MRARLGKPGDDGKYIRFTQEAIPPIAGWRNAGGFCILEGLTLRGAPIHAEEKIPPESAQPERSRKAARLLAWSLILAAPTAVVIPMLLFGNASGHDFQFHIASWLDVSSQWHQGILFPRWAQWANWGFGEPRFIFYPPASWLLGAGIGSILPWDMAAGAYVWLVLALAGFSAWQLAREWLPSTQAAAAAFFYALNPYHLVIVYYRSDFAELLASAIFPLVVWGALRVVHQGWRGVPLLAVPFAAIWLSNAPAGVIASYSLVLILAAGCIECRSLRPLLPGAAAIAAGFGLAAFYIIPAAWEQKWVQIVQALGAELNPGRNFLFARANDPEFVLFNWKVSAIALGMMLVAGIAAVFVARRRREFPELWWMLLLLGVLAVFLMTPASLLLWSYLPQLRFVQFPWRWLGPLGLVFAIFVATAAPGGARRQWAWWLGIFVCVAAIGTAICSDAWWDSDDALDMVAAVQSHAGYEGTDEYAPLECYRRLLPHNAPQISEFDDASEKIVPARGAHFIVRRWSAENVAIQANLASPATLALRLLDYPAWEIRVDGARSDEAEPAPDTGQILVPVGKGKHRLEISFRRTPDRSIGGGVSIISFFVMAGIAAATRRKPRIARARAG